MAEEQNERDEYSDIRVILDLPRLGELIAAVADAFTKIREIDPPDYNGDEMRLLAIAGWHHCQFMSDRTMFQASVAADIAALEELPTTPEPNHQSEFGL